MTAELHDITTIGALHTQLATAIQLEHATIPPYLTAFYSLKPGQNIDAQQILRVIVVEEMLHLTIAANLLNAVGGKVDLTVPGFVPSYPSPLPDGEFDFQVGLGPFSKELIEMFLKIERPRMAPKPGPKLVATRAERASPLAPQPPGQPALRYYSIGDFYAAIAAGLRDLEAEAKAKGETIFRGNPAWQVTSQYYYSGGGQLEAVTDLESATRGINLIIEQGEGGVQRVSGEYKEIAHYYRFHQLIAQRYYAPGDEPEKPTGPQFKVNYDEVYPVGKNLRLAHYPPGSDLHGAAVAFNQAYRKFLVDLTHAFSGQPALLQKAVPQMFALRNQFDVLVRNPLPGTGNHAAPTFEVDP